MPAARPQLLARECSASHPEPSSAPLPRTPAPIRDTRGKLLPECSEKTLPREATLASADIRQHASTTCEANSIKSSHCLRRNESKVSHAAAEVPPPEVTRRSRRPVEHPFGETVAGRKVQPTPNI